MEGKMNLYEVHLHLEGAIFDDALKKISNRRYIVPYVSSKLNQKEAFFEKMNYISREILTCKQDYLDAFDSLCNVLVQTHDYVELIISPRAYDYYHDGDFGEILTELSQKAMKERHLKINFLIDLLKNSGVDKCWKYLDFAKKSIKNLTNVVGINLAGDEIKYPINSYISHIKNAKKHNIKVSVHAGEWGNAEEIWDALEAGADRIGHGIRAVDDESLLNKLLKKNIPLEICPTSNLYTGASKNLNEIALLAQKGINLIINTDDPAIFNTTLEQELTIFRNIAGNYKFKTPLLFTKEY